MSCPRQLTTPMPVTTTRRCAALAVEVPLLPAAAFASTCRHCSNTVRRDSQVERSVALSRCTNIASRGCADRSKQLNLLSCWPASVPPPAEELLALYRAPHLRGSSCTPARGVTAQK